MRKLEPWTKEKVREILSIVILEALVLEMLTLEEARDIGRKLKCKGF